MSDYKERLARAKKNVTSNKSGGVVVLGDKDIKNLHKAVVEMQLRVSNAIKENETKSVNRNTDQLKAITDELKSLQLAFEGTVKPKDISDLAKRIENLKFEPIFNIPKQETPIVNNKINVQDWRREYMFSDSDKTKSTTYVGFVNPNGGWYIERVTKSDTSDKARFVFGKSGYVSNWGKRLQLDYKYLFEAYNGRN